MTDSGTDLPTPSRTPSDAEGIRRLRALQGMAHVCPEEACPLLDEAVLPVAYVDPTDRLIDINPPARRLLGLREQDLHRPIGEIRWPSRLAELPVEYDAAMRLGRVREFDFNHEQGGWHQCAIYPRRRLGRGAVLLFTDISARRQHERRLDLDVELANRVIEALWEPLLVLDEKLQVLIANRAFCETFAMDSDQIVGQSLFELADGCWNRPELRRLLDDSSTAPALRYGAEIEAQFPIVGRRTLRFNVRRFFDRGDRLPRTRYLLAMWDVTDSLQLLSDLRRSEALLLQGQEMAHMGHFEVDPTDEARTYWSPEMYRLLGLAPGTRPPSGQEFLERFIHPEDQPRALREFGTALSTRQPYSMEYRIIRADGEVRTLENWTRLEFDSQGRVIRIFGVKLDVTDRKLQRDTAGDFPD